MKRFWLSYDLGIDGDYDSLFMWLDQIGAVECGTGCCSFLLDVSGSDPGAEILHVIERAGIKFRTRDRLYLIWRRDGGRMTGKFIVGGRRRAPWSGYAIGSSEESEDDAD